MEEIALVAIYAIFQRIFYWILLFSKTETKTKQNSTCEINHWIVFYCHLNNSLWFLINYSYNLLSGMFSAKFCHPMAVLITLTEVATQCWIINDSNRKTIYSFRYIFNIDMLGHEVLNSTVKFHSIENEALYFENGRYAIKMK